MKKCLVSMVSDQTIPNILVVTAVKPDNLLLISTESMERNNKSDAILNSLSKIGMDYRNKTEIVKVNETSIPDFHQKVSEWINNKNKVFTFVVNLTGGTKLMSLAAYEFFKGYNAEMIYMPSPENDYFPIHHPEQITPIPTRLSVEAYLEAYGVSIINRKEIITLKEDALKREGITFFIFERYKQLEYLLKNIGAPLRNLRKRNVEKGYELTIDYRIELPAEKIFLEKTGFEYDHSRIRKKIYASDWNYLKGGWLEERLYLALLKILPESSDIYIGVQSEHKSNKNEYDVLVTYNNILYVVECKSLQAKEGDENAVRGGEINEFLYKLGALRQVFGLTPKTLLATTSEDILMRGEIKTNLIERGRLFNSQIIPLCQIDNIEKWLKENVFNL